MKDIKLPHYNRLFYLIPHKYSSFDISHLSIFFSILTYTQIFKSLYAHCLLSFDAITPFPSKSSWFGFPDSLSVCVPSKLRLKIWLCLSQKIYLSPQPWSYPTQLQKLTRVFKGKQPACFHFRSLPSRRSVSLKPLQDYGIFYFAFPAQPYSQVAPDSLAAKFCPVEVVSSLTYSTKFKIWQMFWGDLLCESNRSLLLQDSA